MPKPALLLFAHGSRRPQWSEPLRRLRDVLAERHDGPVVLTFAELQPPTLIEAGLELARAGVVEMTVVPVFFGSGYHVREDLPAAVEALLAERPELRVRTTGSIGEEPAVLAGLAEGILSAAGSGTVE